MKHDQEVFFHFSNFVGNTSQLELGQEVEYTLSARNGLNAGNCIPAENVKIVSKGKTRTHSKLATFQGKKSVILTHFRHNSSTNSIGQNL